MFSPYPWSVSQQSVNKIDIYDAEGDFVCLIIVSPDSKTVAHNTRLIASAPQLYETMKLMIESIDAFIEIKGGLKEIPPRLRQAKELVEAIESSDL